jgi:hypothetical protein
MSKTYIVDESTDGFGEFLSIRARGERIPMYVD